MCIFRAFQFSSREDSRSSFCVFSHAEKKDFLFTENRLRKTMNFIGNRKQTANEPKEKIMNIPLELFEYDGFLIIQPQRPSSFRSKIYSIKAVRDLFQFIKFPCQGFFNAKCIKWNTRANDCAFMGCCCCCCCVRLFFFAQ